MLFTTFIKTKSIYLFLYHIPTKFMIEKKKHFSVVICVCCIISCSETILSGDGISQCSAGCTNFFFLSPTLVATFGKYYSKFQISKKR